MVWVILCLIHYICLFSLWVVVVIIGFLVGLLLGLVSLGVGFGVVLFCAFVVLVFFVLVCFCFCLERFFYFVCSFCLVVWVAITLVALSFQCCYSCLWCLVVEFVCLFWLFNVLR